MALRFLVLCTGFGVPEWAGNFFSCQTASTTWHAGSCLPQAVLGHSREECSGDADFPADCSFMVTKYILLVLLQDIPLQRCFLCQKGRYRCLWSCTFIRSVNQMQILCISVTWITSLWNGWQKYLAVQLFVPLKCACLSWKHAVMPLGFVGHCTFKFSHGKAFLSVLRVQLTFSNWAAWPWNEEILVPFSPSL